MWRAWSSGATPFPSCPTFISRTRNNELKLTSTDLDMEIVETVPARAKGEGATTVPAHMFHDIVRKLPEGSDIEIARDGDQGRLTISCGQARFSLQTLPADDFPSLSVDDLGHAFTMPAADLKRLIEKTRFAISTEETRYYLNGIYLHAAESRGKPVLRAVATDGHRLAQVELPLPAGAKDMPGVIVPRKTVAELAKLAEDGDGDVRIELSPSKIRVTTARVVLTSKLIDGTFPDYERVIPQGNDKTMEVDNHAFAEAVDRVSTLSSDKGRAVKLSITDGKLDAFGQQSGQRQRERGASRRVRLRSARDRLQRALSARHFRAARRRHRRVPARRSRLADHDPRRQGCVRSLCAHADAGMRAALSGHRERAVDEAMGEATGDASARLYVEELKLTNFRNYERAGVSLDERPVVLVGDNGAGKTNLLEAVSLLGPGQGLRGRDYGELARKDGPGGWAVAATVMSLEGVVEIGTGFGLAGGSEGTGRSVRIAGKDQSAGALAHYVQLVWVIPEMDGLFTGPASERRRFLDRLMLAIDPKMSGPRGRYDRAMRQRNRLFQMREGSPSLFAGLEEQMAEAGVAIAAARLDAVARLSALIEATHEARGPGPFPFAVLSLEGTLERALMERPAVEVEDDYVSLLSETRERDRLAGRALAGPHLSDLIVIHGPHNAPAGDCSSGEQKALLLGLVLAKARLIRELSGAAPLVLFDEVAAHLDGSRREAPF